MLGSQVEDVSEQDWGRGPGPPTRGRKDKFVKPFLALRARL